MPNHLHTILVLDNNVSADISQIIKQMKEYTTKKIGTVIWQKSYYDHIIRNEQEYMEILKYITENPLKWDADKYFV